MTLVVVRYPFGSERSLMFCQMALLCVGLFKLAVGFAQAPQQVLIGMLCLFSSTVAVHPLAYQTAAFGSLFALGQEVAAHGLSNTLSRPTALCEAVLMFLVIVLTKQEKRCLEDDD